MQARMKSGKVIKGKLAETFIRLGIASEVSSGGATKKTNQDEPKRKRRTKAEIEAEKNEET